jgi:hypothetical protein
MSKIDILIFSKDRAMQANFCIDSIKNKFPFYNKIYMLYKCSDKKFNRGYLKLMNKNPHVVYIEENSSFQNELKNAIRNFNQDHCMFLCDDDCFINEVKENELSLVMSEAVKNGLVSCISFRMNPYIDYCYPAKKRMIKPKFIKDDKYLLWDWRTVDRHTCWGYNMAVNGHLYNRGEIVNLINSFNFTDVNNLEANLNCRRFGRPFMISFKETKIFNVQNNFVKPEYNPNDKPTERTSEQLNDMYLEGHRIEGIMIDPIIRSCHGTANYIFNKEK